MGSPKPKLPPCELTDGLNKAVLCVLWFWAAVMVVLLAVAVKWMVQ